MGDVGGVARRGRRRRAGGASGTGIECDVQRQRPSGVLMEYRRRLPLAPVGWAVIALDARAACAAHAAHATRRPPPATAHAPPTPHHCGYRHSSHHRLSKWHVHRSCSTAQALCLYYGGSRVIVRPINWYFTAAAQCTRCWHAWPHRRIPPPCMCQLSFDLPETPLVIVRTTG